MLFPMLMQAAAPPPTIQLTARVEAREVTVEQPGEASLTVRAEPDAGSRVEVIERPRPDGRRVIRNYRVDIDARAVVADPQQPAAPVDAPVEPDATEPPNKG